MAKKNKHHFVIAGDGIAGRGIALGLAQCGFTSTIIAPANDPVIKGGVQLARNGWEALGVLGIDDALTPGAIAIELMRVLSLDTGHSLTQLVLNDRPHRTLYASVTRAHLMKTMGDLAKSINKVSWLEGRLKKVTTKDDGAVITLDDDTIHHAQWLIGADSMAGVCRAYVEAHDDTALPPDLIARRVAFRMAIKNEDLPATFSATASNIWLGDGGHVVYYPLADGTVNVVAVVSQSPSALARVEAMLAKQLVLTPLIPHLKNAVEQPLFNHSHLDTYQRGRVVLAGDAAHPMPPHLAQGAGQALVDAASLSAHLDGMSPDDDLTPVFTRWTAERVRAIRRVRRSADRAGAMFALSGPMARLRNIGLSTFGGGVLERQLDEIWRS